MKAIIVFLIIFSYTLSTSAQIGYQVSLLNKATGEPRANETVSVDVRITDSKDNIIFSGSQSATTNDFGVLSLSVGNEDTFNNVDWNNLPLFVSASIDNVLLGRSQILSVPVAEHAKHTGSLTKKILISKSWNNETPNSGYYIKFDENFAYLYYPDGNVKYKFNNYIIEGNLIILYNGYYLSDTSPTNVGVYIYSADELIPLIPVS